jgi:hypothetical protein
MLLALLLILVLVAVLGGLAVSPLLWIVAVIIVVAVLFGGVGRGGRL